jgi:hypothetical protein
MEFNLEILLPALIQLSAHVYQSVTLIIKAWDLFRCFFICNKFWSCGICTLEVTDKYLLSDVTKI